MIIKEYTIKQFKEKHKSIYNDVFRSFPFIDVTDPLYIVRTLENGGDILHVEVGYKTDDWLLT